MKTCSISEARSHLPSLIDDVALSKKIVVILRHGKPVASIVPYKKKASKSDRYPLRGVPIKMAKDFDKPMPDLWKAFVE
jgi:antitoxin (DNA-binding transcriptional repressor) of toxin-antitoxin stability system